MRQIERLTVLAHGDPGFGWALLSTPREALARAGVTSNDPRPILALAPLDGVLAPVQGLEGMDAGLTALRGAAERTLATVRAAQALGPEALAKAVAKLDVRPIAIGASPTPECEDDLLLSLPGEPTWGWSLHPARSMRDDRLALGERLDDATLAPGVRIERDGAPYRTLRHRARVMRIAGDEAARVIEALSMGAPPPGDLPARTALARLAARGAAVARSTQTLREPQAWSRAGVTPTRAEEIIASVEISVCGARRPQLYETTARRLAPYEVRVGTRDDHATHCLVEAQGEDAHTEARRILARDAPWIMLARSGAGTAVCWGHPGQVGTPCPACVMAALDGGPVGTALGAEPPQADSASAHDEAVGEAIVRCLARSARPGEVTLIGHDAAQTTLRDQATRRPDCPVCASASTRHTGPATQALIETLTQQGQVTEAFPPRQGDARYLALLAQAGPLTQAWERLEWIPLGCDRDEALVARAQVSAQGRTCRGAGRTPRDAAWRAGARAASEAGRRRIERTGPLEGADVVSGAPRRVQAEDALVIESALDTGEALRKALLGAYAHERIRRGDAPRGTLREGRDDPWAQAIAERAHACGTTLERRGEGGDGAPALATVREQGAPDTTHAAGASPREAAHEAMARYLAGAERLRWEDASDAGTGQRTAARAQTERTQERAPGVAETLAWLRAARAHTITAVDLSHWEGPFATVGVTVRWEDAA